MQTKRCSTCKETKPVSEFGKNRSREDGLHTQCKVCKKKSDHKYREANREKLAESNRRYREANREKEVERYHKYRESNKEKIAEKNRRYYEANKEKIAERGKRWRIENRAQAYRTSAKHIREVHARSLEVAHRQRWPWEDWEDEFILADNGLTVYQKAVKLERSYYSIRNRRICLRRKSAQNELTNDY